MFHKKTTRAGLTVTLLAALGLSAASCGGAVATTAGATTGVDFPGVETAAVEAAAAPVAVGGATTPAVAAAAHAGGLTAGEIESLSWMREEEKPARDVYLAMFDLWGLPAFESIAASEARHLEAVLGLIEAYGLTDPVTDDSPGAFSDPALTALYTELVERGSQSLVEALTVGALIEDLDIRDLEAGLAATERADVEWVYENLLGGSINHLRAFTSRLEAEGVEYEVVYHSEDELAALLATASGGGLEQQRGRDH